MVMLGNYDELLTLNHSELLRQGLKTDIKSSKNRVSKPIHTSHNYILATITLETVTFYSNNYISNRNILQQLIH